MPYIRLIPKVTAVAGETLQLKCPVAGYPIEEIHWERGGRELPDDLRQKVLPDGTLVISPVEKKADSGVYTCWARNKQGHSARRSGEVSVIVKWVACVVFKIWLTEISRTATAITQSTVSKIESKLRETGDVKDLPKSGHPKITQDKKIDIVLTMEENPQSISTLVASENEVSQTRVLRILRKENYHPYKFQLVQELNEDDPDR
ncbi:hypothetical protein NQ318_006728 [Aromia moschata]|uniref:Ig-like domain-containing protein n=1 Tax=Aromia moschata TaxID=1265417 RepID=A0AAV8YCE2_9CUCU|nr:hypothetical protein NQ318_006728 [Aromia moschata]